MRGWIEIHENTDAAPDVSVAVEFPQMFTSPAHHRVFHLDQAAIDRLLDGETNGTFEFLIDDELM